MNELVDFRKDLHKNPELSGQEFKTAKRIVEFMKQYSPDEIIENVGGHGVMCIFKGQQPGKTTLFRADMDALAIKESNNFEHKSINEGVSHKCGHDGHMAILAGFGKNVSENRPEKGKIILLFQPAEENGTGARKVVEDEKYKENLPDFVFALHNFSEIPRNSIIIKNGLFLAASTGMKIKLNGKTTHAYDPYTGINPTDTIFDINNFIKTIQNEDTKSEKFGRVNVVGINIGGDNFGTIPGDGSISLTMRAYNDRVIDVLKNKIELFVHEKTNKEGLDLSILYPDDFKATVNTQYETDVVVTASKKVGVDVIPGDVILGSEDFGSIINSAKHGGAFFGLGAGDIAGLHHEDYDFPDEIIETGIKIFDSIRKIIEKNNNTLSK